MSSVSSPRRAGARRRAAAAGALAGVLAALALGAAACGSSDGGRRVASADDAAATGTTAATTAAGAADREQAMLRFARCMRDEGVDFPDPRPDAQGNLRFTLPRGDLAGPAVERAMDACRAQLPAGGPGNLSPEDRARFQDAALDFARCMRKEGIDMPDPTFDGRGGALRALAGLDRDDPRFQAAQKACEHYIRDVAPGGAPARAGG